MTPKQFAELLEGDPRKEQFARISLPINYPALKISKTLTGANEIYAFVTTQVKGYSKMQELSPSIANSKVAFENAKSKIEELVSASNPEYYSWENALRPIIRDQYTFDHPATRFIVKLENESPQYLPGALIYFSDRPLNGISDKNTFLGFLLAAEFENLGLNSLLKRSRLELEAIEKSRTAVEESTTEITASLAEYMDNASKKVKDFENTIDEITSQKSEELDKWVSNRKDHLDQLFVEATVKQTTLEDTYQSKLRLEPAAQYWNQRATALRKDGQKWICWLIVDIGISVGILISVLLMISNGTIADVFKDVGAAVKWSIVFITLVSFMAYGLRILSRLAFSSFHLARDAEEREQLAYVFLSLSKDANLDETQRNLITQSLFSRSDSGLLREESSPTMPGNIIDKVTQKAS
jgi:hypothetical protein